MQSVHLNGTDTSMPMVGLGTWQTSADDLEKAIEYALDVGYRHIDTAFNYNNEEVIGNVIQKWIDGRPDRRNELFITTKLPHIANRSKDVEKFLKLSLNKLKLDYVDLYLIHVPFGFVCDEKTLQPMKADDGNIELDTNTDHISLWKTMEQMVEMGLTKNIGLSNFNMNQIESIYKSARIKPQVLQIECHAYLQQMEMRKFCEDRNIIVTAYSPLGSPGAQNHFTSKYNYTLKNHHKILDDPTVKKIAGTHNKSAGQILLRHLVERNVAVIPKSSNFERIKQNFDIFDFELSSEEIKSVDTLDKGESGRIIDFYFWKGCERHPQFPFGDV